MFRVTTVALICLPLLHAQTPVPSPVHFVVIGVDGLSVDGIRAAKSPRLHKFMEQAAWTLEARAVMPTLSSPNWESIITGSAPEQHGITSNGYLKEKVEIKPLCLDAAGKFPTIFQILRDQKPNSRIAVIHDWDGFADLLEKSAPDFLQHEAGPRKTVETAVRYWNQNHPDLMFVHLDNVDHAGHEYGWSTREYYAAVEEADTDLGKLLDAVEDAPGTYVLITSDHGGKGRGHGGNSMGELLIPWMLSGPGVSRGQLAAPVNTFDSGATMAWLLGLTQPDCWIGRPVLAAFQADVVASRNHPAPSLGTCAVEPAGGAAPGLPPAVLPHDRVHNQ